MTTTPARPTPEALLAAWLPFRNLIGGFEIKTADDYARALAQVENLLDHIGAEEDHPLAELLDILGTQMARYEAQHVPLQQAEGRDVLQLLMEEQGLKQIDLADCAPQGRISDILSGRRGISKALALKFSARFGVRADLFL
jgi:HTH-type transcriptional regulator / antitoxin HigA